MNTKQVINFSKSWRFRKGSLLKSTLFFILPLLLGSSCEKSELSDCYQGRIIQLTCGGTVVQVLSSQTIGETWTNNFKTPTVQYSNCLLAGNIPEQYNIEGDTIYFNFKKVDKFSNGDFCDIGGLPRTKAELSNLSNHNCVTK